jgi:hypothetical protein
MSVAKKMATDFMILLIQKFSVSFTRTEALKIHIPSPWLFFMGAIQASKELHIIILSRILSWHLLGSCLTQRSNAVECNNGNAL